MKRLALIFSMVFITASVLPTPALSQIVVTDDVLYYEVYSDGTAKVVPPAYYTTDYVSGSITIPEKTEFEGKTYNITTIGREAFSSCKSLMSVRIPNSVINIEGEVFSYCTSLMNVTLPISLQSIGAEAFKDCKSLENIVIPDSVTFIGVNAFSDCSSLKTITIPFSASLANGVFKDCRALSKIIVSSDSYYTSASLLEKYSSAISQIDLYSSRPKNVAIELATTNKSVNQATANNNNSSNQNDSKFSKQLRLAEQGSAVAQNYVGWCYEKGEGVAKNYSEAYKWYMKSAEQGNSHAQNNVGGCYYYGNGVEQDYSEAFKWYMKAAEQGHSGAQNSVGYSYDVGRGVEQNYSEAFKWYMKAAEQGYDVAQDNVGIYYENGYGVSQNYSEAFKWYKKSADQGYAQAQNNVGRCYEYSMGVEQNYSEAFKWYRKSADQGYVYGQYNLGRSYVNGRGVGQNYTEAFKWYMKAAEQGHTYAQNSVGYSYGVGRGVEKNYSEAFKWYMKAAEQGYDVAQDNVGIYYENGYGVSQNYSEAFKWYKKSADQGYARAQNNVGRCYEYSMGVEQNYSEAFKWYLKAAEQGHSGAYNKLAYLYMEGNGVKKDEGKAFEMIDKAIELSPDDPDYYDSKGEFYSILGDKEHALEMWNKIMSLDPKYAESKNTKFVTYIRRLQGGVDFDIPQTNYNNNTTFAVIIANESYNREEDVSYALNDGKIFSEYCSKTLGIPEKNLHLIKNATLNDIRHEVNWVTNVMDAYNGDAKVIFYYAGHGIPDERTKAAYLLPVDGYGSDVTTGYSLSDLYSTLGGVPSKSVIVLLDACFSGAKRDGTMLASSRGVAIKINQENPIGNLIVFSASQGDETAFPYVEQGHGMFTYFILKKLQETKGDVTMGELSDYVTTQVKRESAVINNKPQTPTLIPSQTIATTWRNETIR